MDRRLRFAILLFAIGVVLSQGAENMTSTTAQQKDEDRVEASPGIDTSRAAATSMSEDSSSTVRPAPGTGQGSAAQPARAQDCADTDDPLRTRCPDELMDRNRPSR